MGSASLKGLDVDEHFAQSTDTLLFNISVSSVI